MKFSDCGDVSAQYHTCTLAKAEIGILFETSPAAYQSWSALSGAILAQTGKPGGAEGTSQISRFSSACLLVIHNMSCKHV